MKKAIMISTLLLASLSLTACGKTDSSSSSSSSSSKATLTKKKTTENDTSKQTPTHASTSGVTLANYKSIKIALPGSGTATDEAKVKELFGKPAMSSKTTVMGLNGDATEYSWTNMGTGLTGATVTVSFYGGKAVEKGYSDAKLTPNDKINAATLATIKDGDSLESVEAKLGTPNVEAISGSGSLSAQTINYTSIKGDSANSASFVFSNNRLISTDKIDF